MTLKTPICPDRKEIERLCVEKFQEPRVLKAALQLPEMISIMDSGEYKECRKRTTSSVNRVNHRYRLPPFSRCYRANLLDSSLSNNATWFLHGGTTGFVDIINVLGFKFVSIHDCWMNRNLKNSLTVWWLKALTRAIEVASGLRMARLWRFLKPSQKDCPAFSLFDQFSGILT